MQIANYKSLKSFIVLNVGSLYLEYHLKIHGVCKRYSYISMHIYVETQKQKQQIFVEIERSDQSIIYYSQVIRLAKQTPYHSFHFYPLNIIYTFL